MERMSIDWPDVLRRMVEEKVLLEKRRRAAARMDASRKKTVGVRFNSTREIRKMRDARWPSVSPRLERHRQMVCSRGGLGQGPGDSRPLYPEEAQSLNHLPPPLRVGKCSLETSS